MLRNKAPDKGTMEGQWLLDLGRDKTGKDDTLYTTVAVCRLVDWLRGGSTLKHTTPAPTSTQEATARGVLLRPGISPPPVAPPDAVDTSTTRCSRQRRFARLSRRHPRRTREAEEVVVYCGPSLTMTAQQLARGHRVADTGPRHISSVMRLADDACARTWWMHVEAPGSLLRRSGHERSPRALEA
jgi:hypothetical protein